MLLVMHTGYTISRHGDVLLPNEPPALLSRVPGQGQAGWQHSQLGRSGHLQLLAEGRPLDKDVLLDCCAGHWSGLDAAHPHHRCCFCIRLCCFIIRHCCVFIRPCCFIIKPCCFLIRPCCFCIRLCCFIIRPCCFCLKLCYFSSGLAASHQALLLDKLFEHFIEPDVFQATLCAK